MSGYRTIDAPTGDELSACVQCGLCLPFCPTFRLTGVETASPRGRLAAMRAVLEGTAQIDSAFDEAMSFCLGCRACEAVCPGLVPYGRLIEGARAELTAQRSTPTRRVRRVLLGRALASRPLIRLATLAMAVGQRLGMARLPGLPGRGLAGMRPMQVRRPRWVGRSVEPGGAVRGTAMLLAGCVMDDWFGGVHDATVGLLTRAGYRVVVPPAQTCCGALAAHDGHPGEARRLAAQNVAAFAGTDLIVSDSAGCTAHLKEYGHFAAGGAELAARVRDVTEVVADLIAEGGLPMLESDGLRIAIQDPCHLRHAQRIVAQPRAILRAAGIEPVEIDPDGLCCGAAGIYSLLRPTASAELGERKAAQVRAVDVDGVASANPGCEMQLRAYLDSGMTVAHPVEWYHRRLMAAESGRYAAAPT
ncbi:MAG: (Fe-S)-binding protein [Acidimicrobiia bacterium]